MNAQSMRIEPRLNCQSDVALRTGPFVREAFTFEPRAWVWSRRKRTLDLAVALTGVVVISPLLLLVAALIKLTSKGSVFFRQTRVGAAGRLFEVIKFRTMRSTTHHSGVYVTKQTDNRITPIGRLLRRYKIDELPQLFNVIRGEMSIVGPRPLVPEQDPILFDCKPGITSAASLVFHDQEALLEHVPDASAGYVHDEIINPAKAAVDADYMRNSTLRSDLRVILSTAAKIWCRWNLCAADLDQLDIAERVRTAVRECHTSHAIYRLSAALGRGEPPPCALGK
jgi:lipopolysaccharide/colanic/teichoic acid biosynthesis glycosyltransferase